jgi:hypothetical protein
MSGRATVDEELVVETRLTVVIRDVEGPASG